MTNQLKARIIHATEYTVNALNEELAKHAEPLTNRQAVLVKGAIRGAIEGVALSLTGESEDN